MKKVIFLITLLSITSFAQEADIARLISEIEKGRPENAFKVLPDLKKKFPANPSVIYLDAILTSDGKEAFDKYKMIYEKYPGNEYADASMYSVYSYLYSTGNYISAGKILKNFREKYPNSAWLKIAEEMENPFTEPEVLSKTAPESSKTVNGINNFTVQAGAFLYLSNAQRLKKNFENAGYVTEIKEKVIGGSNFNVVYAGKFKTENEAKVFLSELKDKFNVDGRVVPVQ